MVDAQVVWVDAARCIGCGACVDACPVAAVSLLDGKACVDEEKCTGCEACVDVCPEGAIQPVVQGELVPASEWSSPAVHRPGTLTRTAGTAIATVGAGLLMRAAGAVARAVGRWLTRRPLGTGSLSGRGGGGLAQRGTHERTQDQGPQRPRAARVGPGTEGGRGRRARRRRRGG
jgi:NAD-dependent dihydropyrimidine dehydrogenase PreA subunit